VTTVRRGRALAVRGALLAAGAGIAVLPRASGAQQAREVGIQAAVMAEDPAVVAGGVFAAIRSTRRLRIAATASLGAADGATAWRGELLGHFLLNPGSRRAPGAYAGGGVALAGPDERGYVVILVGLEGTPGGRSGWAVEAGLGGGFRATAGWRWRWFSR
jgi:hypothetical protein